MEAHARKHRSLLSRFRKSDDGAAAVEFAMVAGPFFLIVAFIVELGIGYLANKVLDLSVDNVARQIRVGALTTDSSETDSDGNTLDAPALFRREICGNFGVSIFFNCDDLLVDVRQIASWADRPDDPDREENAVTDEDGNPVFNEDGSAQTEQGALKDDDFGFAPGGRLTINVVRVYVEWPTIIDFNNTNSRHWVNDKRLMGSSTAFLTEPF